MALTLERLAAAGLAWPLPEALSDRVLEGIATVDGHGELAAVADHDLAAVLDLLVRRRGHDVVATDPHALTAERVLHGVSEGVHVLVSPVDHEVDALVEAGKGDRAGDDTSKGQALDDQAGGREITVVQT